MGDFFMESRELMARLGGPGAPRVFDVRRREAFQADPELVPTAAWRDHRRVGAWASAASDGGLVVYCAHGEQVSQSAAAVLRARGRDARVLRGGLAGWRAAGGRTLPAALYPRAEGGEASRWVLPHDFSLARLGEAWLVRRFLDPGAEFLFVAADQTDAAALELDAVALTDAAGRCPLVAQALARLAVDGDPLDRFAKILAADPEAPAAPRETAGCAAVVDGFRASVELADARLERSLALCDALYAGLRRQAANPHAAQVGRPA